MKPEGKAAVTSDHALDLVEEYVRNVALPDLEKELPEYLDTVAIGLVGNGSECFGYDDLLSRDHDWGIDFFIWVPSKDAAMTEKLTVWKERLLEEKPPIFKRGQSTYGAHTSVMTVEDFYRLLIGVEECPQTVQQWARIPEESLAISTNGRVFHDGAGAFTQMREELLEFYPEELRFKRIATACMIAAALGQYNFMRMYERGDVATARRCLQDFIVQAERLSFLLNRRFRPYYKWTFRAMGELPILGQELSKHIVDLSLAPLDTMQQAKEAEELVERMCIMIEDELRAQGLSDSEDAFIQRHGESVFTRVQDPWLRGIPITFEM